MPPNENEFNLTGVFESWKRKWKTIALFVIICLIVSTIILAVLPKQYEAKAVAIAGNPLLSDKAHLFNKNIDQLYSNYGTADDLDRLLGIANLDTTYKIIVDSFKLIDYYKVKGENNNIRRYRAVEALKKDVEVRKDELNQLIIGTWNKNPVLAAAIANSIITTVENISSAGLEKYNSRILNNLDSSLTVLRRKYESELIIAQQQGGDAGLSAAENNFLLQQIEQYQKTYDEIKFSSANKQSVIVLQQASPPAKAGKPAIFLWLFGVLVASLAFSLLSVLLIDKKPE